MKTQTEIDCDNNEIYIKSIRSTLNTLEQNNERIKIRHQLKREK